MAKDVNLYSQEWCDIVFEGKNKDYGAYQIRLTSSKRHIIALIAILFLTIFVAFIPTIVTKVKEAAQRRAIAAGLTEKSVMTELEDLKDEIEEIRPEALPPPPLMATIKFTPPVITASEEMTDDDAIKSMDELQESKSVVSIADVVGDPQGKVDIRDLEVAKEVVQQEEEIHRIVEQMPEFPGGMQELNQLIKKRLQYPQMAAENNIQGTTVVQFAVMKDGTVDKVTVYASSHPLLDKEAVRVVKTLPRWIPGKINGKGVNSYFIIPIVFTLQ